MSAGDAKMPFEPTVVLQGPSAPSFLLLLVFEFANRWRKKRRGGEDEQSAVISLGRFFHARSFNKAG